jgi:hypothetical protein
MGRPTYSAAGDALCGVGTSRPYKRGKGGPSPGRSFLVPDAFVNMGRVKRDSG